MLIVEPLTHEHKELVKQQIKLNEYVDRCTEMFIIHKQEGEEGIIVQDVHCCTNSCLSMGQTRKLMILTELSFGFRIKDNLFDSLIDLQKNCYFLKFPLSSGLLLYYAILFQPILDFPPCSSNPINSVAPLSPKICCII